MQTVITYYKNLTRWDVKYFASNLFFGDNLVELKEFLIPKTEKIKKGNYTGDLDVVKKITFSDGVVYFRDERKTGMDLFKGKKGDLLTSKINIHQGAVAICPQNLVCSTHYHIYQINEKKIIPEYLILALRSNSFLEKIIKLKASSIKNEIGPNVFLDFKIYAPTVIEQTKIVGYYHNAKKEARKLNKKANEKEKAIDDYILRELGIENKEYKKKKGPFVVRFKDLDEWGIAKALMNKNLCFIKNIPLVKMSDVCVDFKNGVNFGSDQVGRGTKFVNIKDVYSEKYVNNERLGRVQLSEKEIKNNQLKNNDIVFVRSSVKYEGVAFPSLIKADNEPTVFCGFLIKCSPLSNLINPNYLLYLLKTSMYRNLLIGLSVKTLITNISQDKIKDLKIPLPPLPKQKEIAKKVETIRAEIAEIKGKADSVLETTQKEIGKMLKA